MGPILTTSSQIQCLHGGVALVLPQNMKTMPEGVPALIETDIHFVIGCPFTIGTKYSPCIRIEWVLGASRVSVDGTPVLVDTSLGKCIGIEGAVQGLAQIVSTQQKAVTG